MAILAAKDPQARLDYGCDWAPQLAAGETITSSTWSVSPGGLTVYDSAINGSQTVAWISGGTEGVQYRLTNRVTLSAHAQPLEKTIRFTVSER